MITGLVVIGAGLVVQLVRILVARHGTPVPEETAAGFPAWLAVAVTLLLVGTALAVLAGTGPMWASSATTTWVLSAPTDRRGLLRKWFHWLAFTGLAVGAAAGALLVALFRLPLVLTTGTGAAVGSGLVAMSVLLQIRQIRSAWTHRPLVAAGLLTVLFGLILEGAGWLPRGAAPTLPTPVSSALVIVVVAAAAMLLVAADRRLGRLTRGTLSADAHVVPAAATAGNFLDLSLLLDVLELRRWRRVGRVRPRSFPSGRWRALLVADLRRQFRTPGVLSSWLALALVPYVVAAVTPLWSPMCQLLTACVATSRLASGLRAVSGSAALRRGLGGGDRPLRLAHLVVPASGAVLWCLGTAPATWQNGPWLWIVAATGATAVSYRIATRPPMDYHAGVLVDIGFGVMVPWGLLRQLCRGLGVLLSFSLLVRLLS
ncbi:DUF6297 family protein [Streptoalloteichus hindustanus]|uniref:Uncharacterized protein n=1 Tax=Streptoalloteichus hindustanus TaxID=2017 RepID=A0A1M5MWS3_STRHI|nr:DUF6297 family protein [Streptoalloteichus hindustanus]SHG81764.1 hypothetical protein SAMN05444320_11483 [Streptoalloteichus hindustanus]